jgi:hypothetical protein
MIPIPPWMAGFATDKIVKLAFALGFALCFFLIGMGVHKTFSDRKIARMERDWAEQRAVAAEAYAQAERTARETERHWQENVQALEAEHRRALDNRDRLVRDLRIVGNGLRNKLDGIVAASQASAASGSACGDVHKQAATLGVLLREADGLAEESGLAADALGDDLRTCRAYVEAVTKQD